MMKVNQSYEVINDIKSTPEIVVTLEIVPLRIYTSYIIDSQELILIQVNQNFSIGIHESYLWILKSSMVNIGTLVYSVISNKDASVILQDYVNNQYKHRRTLGKTFSEIENNQAEISEKRKQQLSYIK